MAPPVDLTPRQRQVARLLDQGKTQREIAERLGLHRRTIDGHVKAIRAKTDARTTREAVPKARRKR